MRRDKGYRQGWWLPGWLSRMWLDPVISLIIVVVILVGTWGAHAEKNPRRPVMTQDVFNALVALADQVHPQLKLALVVAEGTGRRLSAWRQLRWDDVDFEARPYGAIRWRAGNDKQGYEEVVPISLQVREELLEARRLQKAIGTAWVFPSDQDPSQPAKRELFDQRLRRAYQVAKAEKAPGSLWHALRRKWATERKGYPISDLAAAGAGATSRH